ncbi:hypothetical protein DMB66_31565 [Actinoplanes sp. ATCC 53533]|uniref:DUF624 domain-containing protein n=1 Tax=Actinoplanes sp. ATCC 53533 TaxID=1288362 RepID=UPI000F790C61|nr:DUF624 domain-containing protein [Actinoplanes sp. ATCC 53533]RSM57767.1 hypothetical protein DMB66_31565 [Actinoplanes sp. ATCC 53533]
MRRDWRETVRVATDLALLGFVVVLAALPLVTAGAAVAAGSAAVHHHLEHDRWPTARACWSVFRRSFAPGLLAGLAAASAALLVVVDVLAVRAGAVPGGTPLLALTLVLAALGGGYGALVVVAVGADPAHSWRAAVATLPGHSRAAAATAGVVLLTALLAVLVHPALVPVLTGYALFAVHVVARRLSPAASVNAM